MTEAGDRYRWRADAFEALINRTAPERWTSPSPCEGWLARDVVAHVVDYSGHVLGERAGMSDVPVFADFDDPAAAFGAIREVVERVLDDPETPPDVGLASRPSRGPLPNRKDAARGASFARASRL
jgi:hypothetical protein